MSNIKILQDNISKDLSLLKKEMEKYSTYSVFGWCFSYNLYRSNNDREELLHSPAKQISFLIGLLVSTKEPNHPLELDKGKWHDMLNLLNKLFNHYWILYFPEEKKDKQSKEWFRIREVSLQAFFNYFDSGLLASVEQVKSRIKKYLVPFDKIFKDEIGISLLKAIEISNYISKKNQEVVDKIQDLKIKESELREQLIKKHMEDTWSLENMQEEEKSGLYFTLANELFESMNQLGLVVRDDILKEFGDQGHIYLKNFVIERGSGSEIRYPTDKSVFEEKPIILDNNDRFLCPNSNSLFLAINTLGERVVLNSEKKEKYLKSRDRLLEEETLLVFKELVNDGATILTSVYETPGKQYEHDIIIDDEIMTLVIEAKASPPIEPLRDPEKAFIRIRDSFKGNTGIQKAYNQANSILSKLKRKNEVILYDKKGNVIHTIKFDSKKLQIGICVTRDNYGALATDLSLLLEKKEEDDYPWAVNILDLKNFQDAWDYLKYDEVKFCNFLNERTKLHGKVHSTDELEYAGFFILHGDLSSLNVKNYDRIQLNPNYSDIFNDIYYAQYQGGPPVEFEVNKEPYVMDLRESLRKGYPVEPNDVSIEPVRTIKKIGRNEKCPCGSGKKYKNCCG
jgi:SEC-C motif